MDETTSSQLLRLLDEYGVRLHALLAKIAVRPEVADELLQELFLKLRLAPGFAQAPHPEQYLFRAAINLAFDWRKRDRCWAASVSLTGQESSSQLSPVEQTIHNEDLERIMSAVERLPVTDRELVVMRFLHGSPYEQLAVHLGSTPHRVRALCSKAIARLRHQLNAISTKEANDAN